MIDLERSIADYASFLDEVSLARSPDHITQSEPDEGDLIMVDVQIRDTEARQEHEQNRRRWLPYTILAAAAVLVVIIAVALFGGGEESTDIDVVDTPEVDAPAETATEEAEAEPPAEPVVESPVLVAEAFLTARAAYDGEAVRALVADDASIALSHEWIALPDEYLLLDDWERAIGMTFGDPVCDEGSPGRVRCLYTMETTMTRALGAGPYDNGFLIEIADGRIVSVSHSRHQPADTSTNQGQFEYVSAVYHSQFTPWLAANHPDDLDLMFDLERNVGQGGNFGPPRMTPESIALWELRVPEFVSSLTEDA